YTTTTDDAGMAAFVIDPNDRFILGYKKSLGDNVFGRDVDTNRFDYLFTVKGNDDIQKKGWTVPDSMKNASVSFTKAKRGTQTYTYSYNGAGRLEGQKSEEGKDKKGSFGLGVGISVLVSNYKNRAVLSGDVDIEAAGLKVTAVSGAEDNKANGGNVSAKAGYSVGNFGFGGAIAVSVVNSTTEALMQANLHKNANATLGGGELTVKAANTGTQKVAALTKRQGTISDNTDSKTDEDSYKEAQKERANSSTGVGAGIAVSAYINDVSAKILSDIVNAKDAKENAVAITSATVSASSDLTDSTNAQAGSEGGNAVTPVLSVDVLVDRVNAVLSKTNDSVGVLELKGNASVTATAKRKKTVKADAAATGKKAAVGGALSISVDNFTQKAYVDRKVRSTAGGLTVQATSDNKVETTSKGSAKGAKEKKEKKKDGGGSEKPAGDGDGDADPAPTPSTEDEDEDEDEDAAPAANEPGESEQNANQALSGAKDLTGADIPANTPVNVGTTEGSVNVAAALALEVLSNRTEAYLDSNVNVAGILTVEADDDLGAKTEANASATVSKIGVGVAVAIDVLGSKAEAYITENVDKALGSKVEVEAKNASDDGNKIETKAVSGAGASDVGVAGSVTVSIVNIDRMAYIHAKEKVQGGKDVVVNAAQKNSIKSESKAGTYREVEEKDDKEKKDGDKDGENKEDGDSDDSVEADGVGVGAAFNVVVADTNSIAYVGMDGTKGLEVRSAGSIAVTSGLDNKVELSSVAGEADGKPAKGTDDYKTSVDAGVGVVIVTADNKALLKKGTRAYAGKDLIVRAKDGSEVSNETKGEATAKKVAAGATVAVNVVVQDILAELAANGSAGGNVVVEANTKTSDMAVGTATANGIETPKFLEKFQKYAKGLDDLVTGNLIKKYLAEKKESAKAKGNKAADSAKKLKESAQAAVGDKKKQ
ncbi:MAG: hypothetical protein ACSW75_02680, partial [Lachnospiraceae bacterium]